MVGTFGERTETAATGNLVLSHPAYGSSHNAQAEHSLECQQPEGKQQPLSQEGLGPGTVVFKTDCSVQGD